ncbi:MAG: hypothetical protein AAFZ74_17465 [Pseudomonadota bacterium]
MTLPSAPDSHASADLADERARADALGLITTADVSKGVESNLILLGQHFEIVAKALVDLGSAPK